MSRRDTIIIAVLVNAALLMILFATAMRSDHSKEDTKTNVKVGNTKIEDLAAAHLAEKPNSDALLNEFITSPPTLAEAGIDNILTFDETEIACIPSPAEVIAAPSQISQLIVGEVKTQKSQSEAQYINVTVKKGDFLEKIAKAHNTTVTAIMNANKMSSTQLKIGQVLKVPSSEGKKVNEPQPAQRQSTPSLESEYYIVKEGDNPWLIASRNKINLEELLRLNGLDEQKAKRLRPGDKLKIR
jgi:peptidoglycan DL-endopeptidase LytF